MKTTTQIFRLTLLILFIVKFNVLPAQQDLTIYAMQSIPQSNYYNPALVPDCKIHIGCLPVVPLPVLSSINISINNSGFTYDDIVHRADDNAPLKVYVDDAVNNLNEKNYLSSNLNLEWLSFGIKIKQVHYVSLGIYEKINFRFCYPKDLVSTLWYGNSQYIGSKAVLDGIGIDLNHYRELALGYSYTKNNDWTLGGRAKLLFGMSNIWTKKSSAGYGIYENNYNHTATLGMQVNMSLEEDLMNRIESVFTDTAGNTKFDLGGYDAMKYAFNMKNVGCALDIGYNYNLSEKFSLSISVIDFGYIHWKTGARIFKSADTSYTFEGLDITGFVRKDPSESDADVLKKTLDTIASTYQLTKTKESYWAPLNPYIYLSGSYSPSKKDKICLMSRFDIYKTTLHPAVTLAYYHKFKNAASFSVNYSYFNHDWLNVGFGGAFKMGPLQFFAATDNILAAIIPYKVKNINLHVGCNYVFFYKTNHPLAGKK
jgi:hypothetical protein